MEQEDLAEPMRSRWSPSVYDDTHVLSPTQIEAMLTAARWAPSCGNAQPWRFVVATRGSASHDILLRHLRRGNLGWVSRASAVFVAATQSAPDEDGEGGYKPAYSDYDLGQAAAHLSLQAVSMGLITHQFAGFDHEGVAADLGMPAYVRVMAGIAVGVPGDPGDVPEKDAEREQKVRRRRPLDRTAYGDAWGLPWRREAP
jgi:nitroreductase